RCTGAATPPQLPTGVTFASLASARAPTDHGALRGQDPSWRPLGFFPRHARAGRMGRARALYGRALRFGLRPFRGPAGGRPRTLVDGRGGVQGSDPQTPGRRSLGYERHVAP